MRVIGKEFSDHADVSGGPAAWNPVCEDGGVSEQPGRYQRSASGMVGAMLVLLLLIAAFVGFRALNREELAIEPERVDYREAVGFAQDAGWSVVYPRSVPDGWRATSIDSQREEDWGIGFLTPDGFVGVRQSAASVEQLLETYVDEEAVAEGPVRLDSELARVWESYSDAGGDLAFAAEVDGRRVLVYGSARATDLRTLAEALTTGPVG